jgi:hypothetical protein
MSCCRAFRARCAHSFSTAVEVAADQGASLVPTKVMIEVVPTPTIDLRAEPELVLTGSERAARTG